MHTGFKVLIEEGPQLHALRRWVELTGVRGRVSAPPFGAHVSPGDGVTASVPVSRSK